MEGACSVDLDGALSTVLEVGQRTLRVRHAVLLRLKHTLNHLTAGGMSPLS